MYILLRFISDCAIGFYFTISRLLSAIHPLIPAKKTFYKSLCCFFELGIIQLRVKSALCKQFFVRALLCNISVLHDQNHIRVPDRRKSVGNDKSSFCPSSGYSSLSGSGFLFSYRRSWSPRPESRSDCQQNCTCNRQKLFLSLRNVGRVFI